MKICIISHALAPEKLGGAEIYARRSAFGLKNKGHDISIITQAPFSGISSIYPRQYSVDGLRLWRFYPMNIFSIYEAHKKPLLQKALWRIIDFVNPHPALMVGRILKKEKPDIVHLHITHGFSPFILMLLLKKMGIPFVITLHSYGLFCLRCDLLHSSGAVCDKLPAHCRAFARLAETIIDGIPRAVISPSRFCLDTHHKNGLFKNYQGIILPNPIGEEFKNTSVIRVTSETFDIVYSGRLTKNKGVHILIEAVRNIDNAKLRLYIAGDGAWKDKLKKLAGSDKRILFSGKMAAEELKRLYQRALACVIPSIYYEPFGNVIIESFAQGTPVVGSRIGAIPEIIVHGINGYLFKPKDAEELKCILESLINEPEKHSRLSRNAFLSAQKYGIEEHISQLEKIYAESINSKPGA